jgi:L-alanine-DL-glutamate epimerase-like enolase superfamily enzyme
LKIASVEAVPLGYPEPNDHGLTRYLTLVKMTTDAGVVGWGETWTRWPEATRAACELIDGMAPLLIGADPLESERLWDRLRRHSYWYGTGGLASFAISGLDIAIWDLKGKILGVPLITLFGGALQERLPAIASSHASHADLREGAEQIGEWLDSGLQGIKFGMTWEGEAQLGHQHERDVEFVRLVRERIGPEPDIMVDVRGAFPWDLQTATRRVRALEEHGLRWIEEPFKPNQLSLYRELRARVSTLVGFGERSRTVEEFEQAVATGLTDVVGVDPGSAEGITGTLKVISRIEAAQRHFNAHAWSGALITAASLALSASTSSCLVFEVKPIRNPMQHDLVAEPLDPIDGWISPPSSPGLGVEVLDDAVAHYRLDR